MIFLTTYMVLIRLCSFTSSYYSYSSEFHKPHIPIQLRAPFSQLKTLRCEEAPDIIPLLHLGVPKSKPSFYLLQPFSVEMAVKEKMIVCFSRRITEQAFTIITGSISIQFVVFSFRCLAN